MITLAEKVRFLSDVTAYPRVTAAVEAKETHMSWVFLADDRVYKLKKPVKYPFLDFSTLARRRFFCKEELRLNRRLAGDTYRAVIPLCCDRTGGLSLFGPGRIIDWLVEMERLSQADMLDVRLSQNSVAETDLHRIGALMVDFYQACRPEIVDGGLFLKHLVEAQAINRAILAKPQLGVRESALPVLDAVDRALGKVAPKIRQRIAEGRIIEGHGDLRPDHVHLGLPVKAIDCLEFSRQMRMVDPYDEINYLGLECALLGAPWIRPALIDLLEANLGGRPDSDVMALYGGFRALLRARLCMAHLLETVVRHPKKWKPLALAYVALARDAVSSPCLKGQTSTGLRGGA